MLRMMLAVAMLLPCAVSMGQDAKDLPKAPALENGQKWVFTMTNFANNERKDFTIDLLKKAKKIGYNGMMVSDVKFEKFQLQGQPVKDNIKEFRKACTDEGMKFIACVASFGYSDVMLSNDPNLAEGMPVRDAEFIVKGGKLVPFDDTTKLVNGGFEEWKGNVPVGWTVDEPDKLSFCDKEVKKSGEASLRQQDVKGVVAAGGHARMMQKIKVKPWHYYHVSVWVKSEDCTNKDWRIFAYDGEIPLNWQSPPIKKTQDWTLHHATFCSLDNKELTLYVGTWNGKEGKAWFDDVAIEPGGFVNVIRRESLPLKVTSLDGKTAFEEGKDFSKVVDPKLLMDPAPGYFTTWHDAPSVTVPEGSKLKDGDKVLVSYHFATTCGKPNNINMCMSEPKTYEIIENQIKWMKEFAQPDVYMLSHDEIRMNGWDDTCSKRNLTQGQILADNIAKCIAIVKKVDPGKPIMIWNDMFDEQHNASKVDKDGKPTVMYMTKGGTWYGSWEGVSPDVAVGTWCYNNAKSLQFFADRGNQQVLAGFYDGDPTKIIPWMETASKFKGIAGVMYTTWQDDYSKLQAFMDAVKSFEKK